ncbi:P-selectin glycoprotein ligand 1 isoform X2 [Trichechus manatus latirostris]|uniref:P-selectin glycoprotein ligand 1 isoform X2 n=1 Tax=Trichechus manatus latirostris TaxID=127582 RepID=A0A2Y9RD96_TRIMA|nr:P-selectin glycoprotein ligand 1 isoform X2 [Trichechus manatus latirostris]
MCAMPLQLLLLLTLLGSGSNLQLPVTQKDGTREAPGQLLAQGQRQVNTSGYPDFFGEYDYEYIGTDSPEKPEHSLRAVTVSTEPPFLMETLGQRGPVGPGTPEPATVEPVTVQPATRDSAGLGSREAAAGDLSTELATQGSPKAQDPLSTGLATAIPSIPKTTSMELTTMEALSMGPTAREALTTEPATTGALSKEPTATVALSMEPATAEALSTGPTAREALTTEPATTGALSKEPTATVALSMEPATTEALSMGTTATEALSILFIGPAATEALTTEPAATGALSKEPTATVALSMEPATTEALSMGTTATEALSILFIGPAATEALTTEPAATGALSKEPTATVALSMEPAATEALSMGTTATEALSILFIRPAATEALSTEPAATEAPTTESATTRGPTMSFLLSSDPQSNITVAVNKPFDVSTKQWKNVQELSPSSSVTHSPTRGQDYNHVKQCLLAILILALVATIFLVCTVVLAIRLSRKNHTYPVRSYSPSEMVCISSLLPDGGEGPNPAAANGGLPNAKTQDPKPEPGESRDADDHTLHSFLP